MKLWFYWGSTIFEKVVLQNLYISIGVACQRLCAMLLIDVFISINHNSKSAICITDFLFVYDVVFATLETFGISAIVSNLKTYG